MRRCPSLHIGQRAQPDHKVLEKCIAEDRILVTQNARDFRRLVGNAELHPGLIILPSVDREGTWRLLESALGFLETKGKPEDAIVNHVLEVDTSGAITFSPLPP
ncbi:DUF5615 family PIN-like protein [Verrucomicrobium sp. 3C]|uniref:DUF5615 family PIN-like protein n=1 Tax=Verrucomicrobium sp. 3C TaxID=1134055 RepID=UPI0012DFF31C|nr:DUF5615 family PIN-like protein [Verrucomicrobium sp. 3C]